VAQNGVGRIFRPVPANEHRVDSIRVNRRRVPMRRTVFPQFKTPRVYNCVRQGRLFFDNSKITYFVRKTNRSYVNLFRFVAEYRHRTVSLLYDGGQRDRYGKVRGLPTAMLARHRTKRRGYRVVRLVRSSIERRRRGCWRPTGPRASISSDAVVLFRGVRTDVFSTVAAVAGCLPWPFELSTRRCPECRVVRPIDGGRVRAGVLEHDRPSVFVGRQQALHVLRVAAIVRAWETGVPAVSAGAAVRVRSVLRGRHADPAVDCPQIGVLASDAARSLPAVLTGAALFRRTVSHV